MLANGCALPAEQILFLTPSRRIRHSTVLRLVWLFVCMRARLAAMIYALPCPACTYYPAHYYPAYTLGFSAARDCHRRLAGGGRDGMDSRLAAMYFPPDDRACGITRRCAGRPCPDNACDATF